MKSSTAAKTKIGHRRRLGQYFTPFEIAEFMSEWILANKRRRQKILDPAAGLGVLEKALEYRKRALDKDLSYNLWEIDKDIFEELKKITENIGIKAELICEDFLKSSWQTLYDGIIANPPYYKHHHIDNKEALFKDICDRTLFNFSLQTNIYCWFIVKAVNQLDIGGRLAFIVPSDFLSSNYGEYVKEYLLSTGVVAHMIKIDFSTSVFSDAITTSVIILGEKTATGNREISFFNVEDVGELHDVDKFLKQYPHRTHKTAELDPRLKWRNYFNGRERELKKDSLIEFSEIGRFSRGIATGANKYFCLTLKETEINRIPNECLVPCITRANHIKDIRFTNKNYEDLLKEGKQVFLFDGQRSDKPACQDFIAKGEDAGVNERHLTRNRNPWFALEKRTVSKIWASVFGRNGQRFIWNETPCLNLTCFHSFHPTDKGQKFLDILFLYLNTNTARKFFDKEMREYGDGLAKFEPNDLNKSFCPDFELLSEANLRKLRQLQKAFITADDESRNAIIKKAEKLFETLLAI